MKGQIENEIIARQIGALHLENARLTARCSTLEMQLVDAYRQVEELRKRVSTPETAPPGGGEVATAGNVANSYPPAASAATAAALATDTPADLAGTVYDADQG